jgi:hypothetical protein
MLRLPRYPIPADALPTVSPFADWLAWQVRRFGQPLRVLGWSLIPVFSPSGVLDLVFVAGAGAVLLRRSLRSLLGLLAVAAAAFTALLVVVAAVKGAAVLPAGMWGFPGAVTRLFGSATAIWLFLRAARRRGAGGPAFADSLPGLLIVVGVALNLQLLLGSGEWNIALLLTGNRPFAFPGWSPRLYLSAPYFALAGLPLLLLPALVAGEGLGVRDAFAFLGRSLRRRPVPTLLLHVGLGLLLLLPVGSFLGAAIGAAAGARAYTFGGSLALCIPRALALSLTIAFFFPASLAGVRALRATAEASGPG